MAITIRFDNRQKSIAFLEAFGLTAGASALKKAERQEAYDAALDLVDAIEPEPRRGLIVHWQNGRGELLKTLDEVIRAILENDLRLPDEAAWEKAA